MFIPDPGSRIPDPDFYPSRIPDPGSRISDPGSRIPDPGSRIPDPGSKNSNKREGWKKFVVIPLFVATNFTKLKIILKVPKREIFDCSDFPDFYPSRIPDLGSRISDPGSKNSNKREGWKKIYHTFLCSHKFHKIENYFSFECWRKNFGQIFKEL